MAEDDEEKRRGVAEFRFGVIAPLVCGRYSKEEEEIIRRGILAKEHVTPDGQRWRVKARTLRRWIYSHKRFGLDGLYDKRRKTFGVFKAIDETVIGAAKAKRKELKSRSIKEILHQLEVEGVDVSKVSKTTLNLYLNRLGAKKERPYSEQGAYQGWRKEHINELWQSDCSDGIWLPDPTGLKRVRQTSLITFIDDASRLCVHGEFYWNERLPNLLDCFKKALIKRGKGHNLYTDNGSIYRSKHWKSVCARLSVGHRFAEKQKPSGKGKVERHYLTIQRSFYKEAQHAGLQTLEELNEFFWAWLDERYHKDKHESLKTSPLERWQREESRIERVSLEKINESLKLCVNRKVEFKTSLICLDGRQYKASRGLGGEEVEVRRVFDEFDEVEVWRHGRFIEKVRLYEPKADIDYSQRPVVEEAPKAGVVLDGSKRYRLALVARHRDGKQLVPPGGGLLSESEFLQVVEKFLNRSLEEEERSQCIAFYVLRRPFNQEFVEEVLAQSGAEKGLSRHIRFYLRRIEDIQLQVR